MAFPVEESRPGEQQHWKPVDSRGGESPGAINLDYILYRVNTYIRQVYDYFGVRAKDL